MKKLTLLLILLFSPFLHAQDFIIGVKGGINFNTIGQLQHLGGSVQSGDPDIFYDADYEMGMQFGVYVMASYDRFFFKPEINYVSLKNTYPLSLRTSNWTATKIDIPILFGYRVFGPITLFGGPSFSTISDFELEGTESPIKFNSSSFNVEGGLLLEFGAIALDLRYQYGFSKVKKQRVDIVRSTFGTNLADLLEYNPTQITLGVQINLVNFSSVGQKRKVNKGWRNHKNL